MANGQLVYLSNRFIKTSGNFHCELSENIIHTHSYIFCLSLCKISPLHWMYPFNLCISLQVYSALFCQLEATAPQRRQAVIEMCVGGNKLQHVAVIPSGPEEVSDYLICLTIAGKGAGVGRKRCLLHIYLETLQLVFLSYIMTFSNHNHDIFRRLFQMSKPFKRCFNFCFHFKIVLGMPGFCMQYKCVIFA